MFSLQTLRIKLYMLHSYQYSRLKIILSHIVKVTQSGLHQ